MHIKKYRIDQTTDETILTLFLESNYTEEFSSEISPTDYNSDDHLKASIQTIVKHRFPYLDITKAKVMSGEHLITTISLSQS